MCGVEFCSMRIDQDARDAGEMDDIADETNLAASAAAEMNQPPTGTHDGGASSARPSTPSGNQRSSWRTTEDRSAYRMDDAVGALYAVA